MLDGYESRVTGLVISPDNMVFVSRFLDSRIQVWNMATGELGRTLQGHETPVRYLALSADGSTLASSVANTRDPAVWIWDTTTGQRQRVFDEESLENIALSPDGDLVAVGGLHSWTKVYDVEAEERLYLLNLTGAGPGLAFSPDGTKLATAGGRTAALWDMETGELLHQMEATEPYAECLAFSPDGRWFASGTYEGTVKLWDAETGEVLGTLEGLTGKVSSLAFSPNGRIVAVGLEEHISPSGEQGSSVVLWDVGTGERLPIGALEGYAADIHHIAFSSDGTTLVTGASDGTVRLWGVYGLR